jgi:hypothetical protein
MLVSITKAQEWSTPVNIYNSDNHDVFPDLCIDNNGVLHCVWNRYLEDDVRVVYYSKSIDKGNTWTEAIQISSQTTGRISEPMIVNDSENNLYVIYVYDLSTPYNNNIYFTANYGLGWTEAESVADEYPNLFIEDFFIDKDDKIYFFFRYYDNRPHYRSYENGEWGEYVTLYEESDYYYLFIDKVAEDSYGNIHAIGTATLTSSDTTQAAYFYYRKEENEWHDFEIIGQYFSSDPFMDIVSDNNNNPHMVWRESYTGAPNEDATFYKKKDNDIWSETEMIVEDPWMQKIDIVNEQVLLADIEKEGSGKYIVFYRQDWTEIWEGQNVVFCEYLSLDEMIHDDDYIYLLFAAKLENEDVVDVYLTRTPIDSLDLNINRIKDLNFEDIVLEQNYPNPFYTTTRISYELNRSGNTKIILMDLNGKIVKEFFQGKQQAGAYHIDWDGCDASGNKLPAGSYYCRLISEDRQRTRILILK